MSREIDQKIVEMQFDNKDFEKNVQTSMSTIERLKKSLDFSQATNSLNTLERASATFTMAPMEKAIDSVKNKISAFEVMSVTTLANITNSAVNAGKQLVKSLSVDQIKAGWQKYEDMTTSTQTIIAATGKDIDYVNERLDKLNWFTDETSYNLTDMTNNIGKFTSAGVDLDKSVSAMEGIALEAALSGQNANAASHAMYNFAQALGAGAVKLQDWKSIQVANMSTKEFKETIIQTAKELGRLDKKGNIKKITGDRYGGPDKVSFDNFESTLAAGWFDSEVLIASLKKYGDFADKLKTAMDKTNLDMTSDMLRYIDQYKAGTIDMETASKNAGVSAEELGKMLKELSSDEYELGLKAFKAGQEAKTFTEAINSIKDAVSTKWMKTFEIIFGNYEEAKVFWTDLANAMYDVFAASGDVRNAILTDWKELGGRDDLLEAFWNLWDAVESIVTPIKEAFSEIFPPITGKRLADITKKIKEFTASLKISDENSKNLKITFKGLFSIFDIFKQALSAIFKIITPLFSKGTDLVSSFGDKFLSTTGSISSYILAFDEFIKENETFNKIADIVISKLQKIKESIGKAVDYLRDKTKVLKDRLVEFKDTLPKIDVKSFGDSLGKVSEKFKNLNDNGEKTVSFLDRIKSIIEKVRDVIKKFVNFVAPYADKLVDFLAKASKKVTDFFKSFNIDSGDALNFVEGGLFSALLYTLINFFKTADKVISSMEDFKKGVLDILGAVKGTLEEWQKDIKAGKILKIAEAIGILAVALLILSTISPEKLGTALVAITVLFTEISMAFRVFSKTIDSLQKGNSGGGSLGILLGLSTALLIISASVKILSEINLKSLAKGVFAVVVLLNALTGSLTLISAFNDGGVKGASVILALASALLIISLAVKIIGSMKLGSVAEGVIAVVILLKSLTGALILVTNLGSSGFKGANILLSLATALVIIAKAVHMLGSMDLGSLAKGVISIGMLLNALKMAMIKITSFGESGFKGAAIILSLSAALVIIGKAVEMLGSMDLGSLAKGVSSVIILLLAMAGAIALITKFGAGSLASAVVILSLAASIMTMATAINLLGQMDIESLKKGIGSLLLVFAGFIATALLAAPILPLLLALGGALTLFGAACLLTGTGILTLAAGLGMLAVTGVAGVAALVPAITMLIDMIPLIAERLALGIVSMVNTLTESIPVFVNFGLALLVGILQGINEHIYDLVTVGISIVLNLINGIADSIPAIIDAGWNLAIQFINGVADGLDNHASEFNDAIKRLAKSAWDAFLDFFGIHSPSKKFEEGGWQLIAGLVQGIGSKISDVVGKIRDMGQQALNSLHEKVEEFTQKGRDLVVGFMNGINDKIKGVAAKGREIGSKVLGALQKRIDSASPSKEAAKLGRTIPLGVVKGASEFGNKLKLVGSNIGGNVLDSISDSMSNIIDLFDYDDSFEPVITPVLDDSNLQYGYRQIESMFNNSNVVSLRAATSLSNSMDNRNHSAGNSSSGKTSVVNNFTQNNYSPKSLSNAEIYRNTKTLFAKEKGVVKTA